VPRAVLLALTLALPFASTASASAASLDGCVRAGNGTSLLSLRAEDGTRLRGALSGTSSNAVVLLHQSDGTVCQWWPFARRLQSMGYMVLALDFRDHGSSGRGPSANANRYDIDVLAAVQELRNHGAVRIFLVGASMGGTAALVAATETPVDGVVDLSGPAQYGPLDARLAVDSLNVPLLFAVGVGDSEFVPDARALHDSAVAVDKRLVVYNGTGHGVQLLRARPEPHASLLIENWLSWHIRYVYRSS
jgi:pimeloyl-ACP methyl ester carboxylesterase